MTDELTPLTDSPRSQASTCASVRPRAAEARRRQRRVGVHEQQQRLLGAEAAGRVRERAAQRVLLVASRREHPQHLVHGAEKARVVAGRRRAGLGGGIWHRGRRYVSSRPRARASCHVTLSPRFTSAPEPNAERPRPRAVPLPGRAEGRCHSGPTFDARGFSEHREAGSLLPFEHIDPFTGNLLLTFTDLRLPGNAGFDLVIQRTPTRPASDDGTRRRCGTRWDE